MTALIRGHWRDECSHTLVLLKPHLGRKTRAFRNPASIKTRAEKTGFREQVSVGISARRSESQEGIFAARRATVPAVDMGIAGYSAISNQERHVPAVQ
jgi:hypothetical protein